MNKTIACLILSISILISTGCENSSWHSEYYQKHPLVNKIWSVAENKFVTEPMLYKNILSSDLIVLGEIHDNPDHHHLQAKIISAITNSDRRPLIAFEMFNVSQQKALDNHLRVSPKDSIGIGKAVQWEKSGWPRWELYEPITRASLNAGLKIRAANMDPLQLNSIIRGRLEDVNSTIPRAIQLTREFPERKKAQIQEEIKIAHCGYAPQNLIDSMTRGQIARDAHMAKQMLYKITTHGAILIAGAGHARTDYGVPFHLQRTNPKKTVFSLAFIEVTPETTSATSYAKYFNVDKIPFDFIWFTPRVNDEDACERFKEQLQKMKKTEKSG